MNLIPLISAATLMCTALPSYSFTNWHPTEKHHRGGYNQEGHMQTAVAVQEKPHLTYQQFIAQRAEEAAPTFADMIHRCLREMSVSRVIGESQQRSMEKAARLPIGSVRLAELTAQDFVNLAILLAKGSVEHDHDPVQLGTIRQYLTYLGGVVDMMKLWKVERSAEIHAAFDEAKLWMDKLHLIGKGRPREQRFSREQQATAAEFFTEQERRWPTRCVAPMVKVMDFALTSLKRQGEITRVTWPDFEQDARMLTVRDMKDPKHKKGNHFRFPLIRGAYEVVMSMPRVDDRIFPYIAHSVSQRWHEAMEKLGYPVHFHDLRREGICRMLEEGYAAHQVAAVSGHKNWNTLARVYANKFDPAELHNGPLAATAARMVEIDQRRMAR